MEQKVIRFLWNYKILWTTQAILGEKNKGRSITLSDFKLYYKRTIIERALVEKQTHRPREQNWEPEVNPHEFGQITSDRGAKNLQWRKESLFNKWCWENWKATCKRMKLDYSLFPSTKKTLVGGGDRWRGAKGEYQENDNSTINKI